MLYKRWANVLFYNNHDNESGNDETDLYFCNEIFLLQCMKHYRVHFRDIFGNDVSVFPMMFKHLAFNPTSNMAVLQRTDTKPLPETVMTQFTDVYEDFGTESGISSRDT